MISLCEITVFSDELLTFNHHYEWTQRWNLSCFCQISTQEWATLHCWFSYHCTCITHDVRLRSPPKRGAHPISFEEMDVHEIKGSTKWMSTKCRGAVRKLLLSIVHFYSFSDERLSVGASVLPGLLCSCPFKYVNRYEDGTSLNRLPRFCTCS